MKTFNKFMMLAGLAIIASLTITSCQVDEPNTNPLDKEGVNLVAFGPNPVARGGYMRFLGTGMDQIASITLAGQELTPLEYVNSEEVKVLIPQDAKIGDVVLKTKGGEEIVGSRQVTYTEPVGFAEEGAFAPNPVKAGQELTIKGEYLNLVTKVILPEGIEITKFKSQSREQIVIAALPAEAQTGKVTLSFVATGDTMAQEIPSEAKLEVVLPSVDKIAEFTEVKAGQELTIKGHNFDLVTAAVTNFGDTLKFTVSNDANEIKVTMPEVVRDGIVNVVAASGITVPVAAIGIALPKIASIEGNINVKEGSLVTIKGTDMAIVSGVNFMDYTGNPVAASEKDLVVTNESVIAMVPGLAVAGSITLLTTAGVDITDDKLVIETLKPVVTAFSPAEVNMGGVVAVSGTDLDLVSTVELTGGAILNPTDYTATSFNITIPYADAESGKLTLNMTNGEVVETTIELTINTPLCAYVIAWPELEDDEPIQAGTLLRIQVGNRDKLTKVEIDGQDCAFLLNGEDVVYINIPESAGKDSKVKLISEGLGEIEYDYEFKPNTEITYIMWKGIKEVTGWSGWEFGKEVGEDPAFLVNLPLQAGDIMRIWITPVDGWTIQFNGGDWTNFRADEFGLVSDPDWPTNINAANADVSKGYVELPFDAAAVAKLLEHTPTWAAFVINGDKVLINKIDIVRNISVEKTIWTGSYAIAGWANCEFGKGAGEPADLFATAGVKKGSKIHLHMTFSDGWGIKFYDGMWSGFNASDFGYTANADDAAVINANNAPDAARKGYVELPILTDEIAKRFTDMTYLTWGMAFVFQGDGLTMKSIGVE